MPLTRKTRSLVIGIGNRYRKDDAAGLDAADRLRDLLKGQIPVLEQSGEGAALMEAWKGADFVVLIDAVQSGEPAGTVRRFDALKNLIPAKFFRCSTHAFSVAESIELARVMNRLPSGLILYGIEGKHFDAGVGLSPEVKQAVSEVVESVRRELKSEAAGPSRDATT